METKIGKLVGAGIAIVLWIGLLLLSNSAKADYITMDVDSSVRSGTVLCATVQSCYIKTLQMEQRGSAQYCNSVTIKRDGRVVWFKNYFR